MLVEVPTPNLDGVEPRIVEDRVVGNLEHAALLADVEASEPRDGLREVVLGLGIVRGPAAVAPAAPTTAVVEHAREMELARRPPRGAVQVIARRYERGGRRQDRDAKSRCQPNH